MNSWLWNPPPRTEWRRLLLESMVIVALGAVIGLSVNAGLLRQVLSGEGGAAVQGSPGEALPQPVLLDEVREVLASGALAVDARLPEKYAEGHIPEAYSFPLAEFDERIAQFAGQVEKNRALVVYCNGYGCPDSFELARRLLQRGYREVRVYEGGFPEWQDAGLKSERGAP